MTEMFKCNNLNVSKVSIATILIVKSQHFLINLKNYNRQKKISQLELQKMKNHNFYIFFHILSYVDKFLIKKNAS